MSETRYISGEWFEVIHSKYTDDMIKHHMKNFACRDLSDFYDKPSDIKKGIYHEWWNWYFESDYVDLFEVVSGSCFTFSIGAIYVDPDTREVLGYFKITKDHNKLFLFK